MSKRIEMLEKLVATGKADAFALYALAMEYRNAERAGDALRTFEQLRLANPEYLAMYLMAGQLVESMGNAAAARVWLEAGVALATKQGNSKAKSELVAALEACD
jgi:hypothetical protein